MAIWGKKADLEQINAVCRGTAVEHLGIEFTEIGEDFLRARMPVDQRTFQPMKLLHGGASVLLAESIGSLAANLVLEEGSGKAAVGLEVNANHLRSATKGWVIGTARALHIGKATQVWEINIESDEGVRLCVSRLTMSIINFAGA